MISFYIYCMYPIRRDNICFRREIKPQNDVRTRTIDTQSDIACEPNAFDELKSIIDEPSAEDNEEIGQSDENVGHRYQLRDVINSRGNHANQRSRDDERHDQVKAKRHKRRQSRSPSEPNEKVHRSRSPSPHVNGRHSPNKLAPNQVEL